MACVLLTFRGCMENSFWAKTDCLSTCWKSCQDLIKILNKILSIGKKSYKSLQSSGKDLAKILLSSCQDLPRMLAEKINCILVQCRLHMLVLILQELYILLAVKSTGQETMKGQIAKNLTGSLYVLHRDSNHIQHKIWTWKYIRSKVGRYWKNHHDHRLRNYHNNLFYRNTVYAIK